ncbi:hypothetical protein Pcinc_027353 [Petrolisthes cinctipes]|uniref:Uncharacterized protein n=1 Tax=Petrolisthes cinctipes TaxID=88211 RepID=A0AAE1K6X3_PETCI|nr:hypothetical protein Pcinc_027353 [Petrolisthes cinctipes]
MGGGKGKGMEEGVRGGWLVNTFLLLLTGWQVVLLPWAPLILRSAGFTPTGVGVVTCLCYVCGSVGVMICLGWVRRTRSGGVRRLLMLVSLAAAILFQVSSVALLQVVGSGSDNPACAATFAHPLSQLPTSSTHHQSDINSTITLTLNATTGHFPLDGQVNGSGKANHSLPIHPKPHEDDRGETSQREPGTEKERHHWSSSHPFNPSHRLSRPHPPTQHKSKLSPNEEWSGTSGNRDNSEALPGDEEESGEDYIESDDEEDVDNTYDDGDIRKLVDLAPSHGSLSSMESHLPSSDGSSDMHGENLGRWDGDNWANKVPGRLSSHFPEMKQRMGPPPVFSQGGSQRVINKVLPATIRRDPHAKTYPNLLSLLPHQDLSPPQQIGTNWWELPSGSLPRHHSPAAPPLHHQRPSLNHGTDTHDRRPGELRRGRRSVDHASFIGPEDEVNDGNSSKDNKKTQRSPSLQQLSRPLLEPHSSVGVAVGVALLLIVGGMAGSGVECGVAQLWHCYTHGYDEGGMSHDVLQRTVTHTFHLCVYASHKAWSGLTSGACVLGVGVISILSCLVGVEVGEYGCLAGLHLTLGTLSLVALLVLPVPYGSIDPPRTRRPLSLYLDDEVLREGVRRLTFHTWVWFCGVLAALSLTFSLWLVQELAPQGWVVGGQAGAVGVTVAMESLTLQLHHRLITRWGLHGVMSVSTLALTLHYGLMWTVASVGVVVLAHAGLGVAMALLWVAVKHNSLLLATVSDQEREAWASWWCWRVGVGVGAILWGVGVTGSGGRVEPLLLLATLLAGILASTVGVAAIINRRSSRTRRRIYHTLDLGMGDDCDEDDDDDDDDAAEDDWLVKRARKEGMKL